MTSTYILEGHTPVLEPDFIKWGHWFETADRKVRKNTLWKLSGGTVTELYVSTVFLGLDAGDGYHPPQLFATMVFGGGHDGVQLRASSWENAEAMHEVCLKAIICGVLEYDHQTNQLD